MNLRLIIFITAIITCNSFIQAQVPTCFDIKNVQRELYMKPSNFQKHFKSNNVLNNTDSLSWMKIYHSECDCPAAHIENAYDGGILLMGWFEANYPKNCWLIKTDVNGDILWERVISGGDYVTSVNRLVESADGSIYIFGSTLLLDNYDDPYLTKLNPCGEKEWCKIFHTPEHMDGVMSLSLAQDGGVAIILGNSWGPNFADTNRICLTRLDQNGNELWRNYYSTLDPNMHNEQDWSLLSTPDNGFLITASCSYEDSLNNNIWMAKCYYIKSNNIGARQWETIAEKNYNPNYPGGIAFSSVLNQRKDYYYSSISRYMGASTISPAILKMSTSGQVVSINEIVSGNATGMLCSSTFVDPQTMVGSACWFNDTSSIHASKAIKFDTLGTLISEKTLLNSDYLSFIKRTRDNKYLFYTMRDDSPDPNFPHLNAYLFKFDKNLNSDSLYSIPLTYDSLCPQISPYDTVFILNCGIILNINEPQIVNSASEMIVSPNPATNLVHITFPNYIISTTVGSSFTSTHMDFQYLGNAILEIYDLNGKQIFEKALSQNDHELNIDVNTWTRGMYFIKLLEKSNTVKTAKLIINR